MTGRARTVEVGFLVALCFFLPIYEAPKNIFCVLYVVVWIVNRVRARDFGGRWNTWDSLIAAWIASGFVVAAFAGAPGGDEWRGALDLLRYGTVLWLAMRSRYSPREIAWVFGALIVSTIVGLAMAYAAMGSGQQSLLQMNSVGHVNHTAVYLAIMFGVCVSWAFAAWATWSRVRRGIAVAIVLLILVSLVVSASRGAIAVGFIAPLIIAVAWWRRSRAPLLIAASIFAMTAVAMVAGGAGVVRKHEADVEAQNVLAFRGEIWPIAVGTWWEYPWFGVGMDNFGRTTPYRKALKVAADSPSHALSFPHGHSLFLNTLAERGLVGFLPLMALLAALLLSLIRPRPGAADDDETWLIWGSAASAWIVTCGVGLVNTTLHHEHGILAALLLGLWLSKRPGR